MVSNIRNHNKINYSSDIPEISKHDRKPAGLGQTLKHGRAKPVNILNI